MTRNDSLHLLIRNASGNGFEFRRWFQANIQAEWMSLEEAIAVLCTESRYYALIFSHDFARAIWKQGAQMNFVVPGSTYSRMNGKGEVVTITRKPFTRRTIKADVWKYHLRQMAISEDPMRYLKRFMPTHEDVQPISRASESLSAAG
jgi:hypothetical protein